MHMLYIQARQVEEKLNLEACPPRRAYGQPAFITRFPLTRFSPGSGLLRNLFFHR